MVNVPQGSLKLGENKVNNGKLKEVDHFKYLGSVLTRDGYCTRDIKMRIAIAILATCPAHLNLLDLITLTILGEL